MSAVVMQIDKAEVRFGAKGAVLDVSNDFSCQVTRAEITSQSNTTTTSVPATFCQPASEVSVPVASTFALNLDFMQDWSQAAGLSAYLFAHDAEEIAFELYLDGATAPLARGTVIAQAGAFGGTPGQPLTSSVTLNIQGYPEILDATGGLIRKLTAAVGGTITDPVVAAATAQGKLTAVSGRYVASPATAWTQGQKVTIGGSDYSWSGTAWAAGAVT